MKILFQNQETTCQAEEAPCSGRGRMADAKRGTRRGDGEAGEWELTPSTSMTP